MAKDIAVQMCDVLDGGEYVGVLNAPNMAAVRKSELTPYVSLGEKMGALQAQLLGQGKVCWLWMVDWLVGWIFGWLVGWLDNWLVGG